MLRMAEAEDSEEENQIENLKNKLSGKKRKVKIAYEDEIEYEYEGITKNKQKKIKHWIKFDFNTDMSHNSHKKNNFVFKEIWIKRMIDRLRDNQN